jgi:hypothetical protein
MTDDDANPSEQFKDAFLFQIFNALNVLFECPEQLETLNIFVFLLLHFYGRNTKP